MPTTKRITQNSPELKEALLSLMADSTDLRELAAKAVQVVLNEIMSAQADDLCNAEYAQRSEERTNYRNGYRERDLATTAGNVTLSIPKLRRGSYFPDSIIERYSRADRALVAAVAEMYLMGVSTRKVEKVVAELGVESMSKDQVSRMCAVLDEEVASFRERTFADMKFPYLWLDATYVKCRRGSHVESSAVITAIAVGVDGIRRFVGFAVADAESYPAWKEFLSDLRKRGIEGVKLVISDAHEGLVKAVEEVYQGAGWQRCIVHLERNIAKLCTGKKQKSKAMGLLTTVFREDDPALVRALYHVAIDELQGICPKAAKLLEEAEPDALAYLEYPKVHQKKLRTNNVQERANREIKRRTKVVQVFPSTASLERLVGAVLAECDEDWSTRCYMSPESLEEVLDKETEPVTDDEQVVPVVTEEVKKKAITIIRLALDREDVAA